MQETHVYFPLLRAIVKVAATVFKIEEICYNGTFLHNFSPMTILM